MRSCTLRRILIVTADPEPASAVDRAATRVRTGDRECSVAADKSSRCRRRTEDVRVPASVATGTWRRRKALGFATAPAAVAGDAETTSARIEESVAWHVREEDPVRSVSSAR